MARGSSNPQQPPRPLVAGALWAPRVLAWLCAAAAANVSGQTQVAVADLPLEQLMQMQVTTASRYAQTALEAPAAVSVVTATKHSGARVTQAYRARPLFTITAVPTQSATHARS